MNDDTLIGEIDVKLSACPFCATAPKMQVVHARDLTKNAAAGAMLWVAQIECQSCRCSKSTTDVARIVAVDQTIASWEQRSFKKDYVLMTRSLAERAAEEIRQLSKLAGYSAAKYHLMVSAEIDTTLENHDQL